MKVPQLIYGQNLSNQQKLFNFFATIGGIFVFVVEYFKHVFILPFEIEETKKHMADFGIKTLPIVSTMGIIVGFVMALQSYFVLDPLGATDFIPGSLGISILREFAPILTALLFAGRVSSGIGAELGSMRVTEQIDAMEVSGINPFKFLVVPRVTAATFILPLLTVYVIIISLLGGFIATFLQEQMNIIYYFNSMISYIDMGDVFQGMIKTFFFGFAVGIVGSYKGYTTEGGTVGVGLSTTSSVVIASLLIIFIDMIMVKLGMM
jgi:phospholipid/cholesterol/gamma-HCH transport system permease protein